MGMDDLKAVQKEFLKEIIPRIDKMLGELDEIEKKSKWCKQVFPSTEFNNFKISFLNISKDFKKAIEFNLKNK